MRQEVTKGSTVETIKERENELRNYATGLAELFDVDREGDDWWTAYSFGDGSFADINVWIDTNGKHEWLVVTAYAVDEDGYTKTDQYRQLYKRSLTAKHNTRKEGDEF